MSIPMSGLGLLTDIDVRVTVELGETRLRLRDICNLAEDRVIMLDRLVDEPLDLLVNGKAVARGEVVAQGNRFGLRIIEVIGQDSAPAPVDAAPLPANPPTERRAPPPIVEQG